SARPSAGVGLAPRVRSGRSRELYQSTSLPRSKRSHDGPYVHSTSLLRIGAPWIASTVSASIPSARCEGRAGLVGAGATGVAVAPSMAVVPAGSGEPSTSAAATVATSTSASQTRRPEPPVAGAGVAATPE